MSELTGEPLEGKPAKPLVVKRHEGRYAVLDPFEPGTHAEDLWIAAQDQDTWTYLPFGPFASREAFDKFMHIMAHHEDMRYYAILDRWDGRALGMMSHMRVKPEWATIEIGGIWFGPELKQTRQATEAIYLSIAYPMEELGYLRMEWKCNDRNDASKRAALRFGFTDEGVHRQHMIAKGVRRDTHWYSILDSEWPDIKARFERWLEPSNFDDEGRQKTSL